MLNTWFEKSRVCFETDYEEEINPVTSAASMVYSTGNEILTKGEREMIDDFENLVTKQLGNIYEVGDMVWGKVRSHPWWPGQIFHEAIALPCVRKTKREGHVLVAFFGDNSYGWFDPIELLPFDIHYVEKSMQTEARPFVDAVEEAEDEARRRAALGLSCQCQNPCNFRATGVKGFVEVDVNGYQPGGVYSVQQIKNAREGFHPFEMLRFVHLSASMPYSNLKRSINWIKNVAVVLAYRKAVFDKVNETYVQALGSQPIHCANSFGPLNLQEQVPSQDLFGKEVTAVKKSALEIGSIEAIVDTEEKKVKSCDRSQGFQQCQPKFKKLVEINHCLENVQVFGRASTLSDAVVRQKIVVSSNKGLDEKPRVLKRLGEDLNSKKALMVGKTKRKKEFKSESGLEYLDNDLKTAKKESDCKPCIFSSDFMATKQMVGLRDVDNKLPQLLNYLLDLALNPFHCKDNIPAIVPQFFLKLRSVIHKKDLVVVPSGKVELIESSPTKSSACFVAAKSPCNGTAQDLPSALKPPKKRLKPDDYGKVGVNSSISDHEKVMSVEELKKINELKLLTAEKKAGSWKLVKSKGRNEREITTAVPTKLTKHTPKKLDASTRTAKPTMIVMQFPHQSALPSVSELKARYARFGQLHSPPRVFWKSSTCQVIFKCKSDATAAHEYAIKNRSLFGGAKVEYHLQALEVPATEYPRPGNRLIGKSPDANPPVKLMSMDDSSKPRSIAPQHPKVQPKSCLKKQPSGEVINIHSDIPYFKYLIKGKESIGTEQLVVNGSIKNCDDIHSNGSSSARATVNINAKNFHKVMPLLPLHPNRMSYVHENHKLNQFVNVCNMQYLQLETGNNHVYATTTHRNMDISQQMLNLLMRCHGIVTDLKCSLGYVPFNL